MEYRIVRKVTTELSDGLNSMENLVNHAMAEGWTISGSLSVTTIGGDGFAYVITQPMTRLRPLPGNNRTTMVNVDIASLRPSNNLNRLRG